MANEWEWRGAAVLGEIHWRLRNELATMASNVVNIAESLAPRRTGELATSIGYELDEQNLSVVFTVGAKHGIFQEYGTRYIPPHPYLRPAINHVFSRTFGFITETSFLNTPHINQPLLATGPGFKSPSTLTAKQIHHVRTKLEPRSQMHYVGAVSRTRMHPRGHRHP